MSNPTLVVVGAGELGRQAIRLARADLSAPIYGALLVADDHMHADEWENSEVAERVPFARWSELVGRGDVLIGLGYHHLTLRRTILERVRAVAGASPSRIHSSVVVADGSLADRSNNRNPMGVLLYPGVVLDYDVSVGDGVVMNVGVAVCHARQWAGA